jgi:hypothetical protein
MLRLSLPRRFSIVWLPKRVPVTCDVLYLIAAEADVGEYVIVKYHQPSTRLPDLLLMLDPRDDGTHHQCQPAGYNRRSASRRTG